VQFLIVVSLMCGGSLAFGKDDWTEWAPLVLVFAGVSWPLSEPFTCLFLTLPTTPLGEYLLKLAVSFDINYTSDDLILIAWYYNH